MAVTLNTYMADVTGVTIRDVAGDGSQIELLVNGYKGLLCLRLIGKQAKVIRVTDLRAKDRAKREKHSVARLRAIAQPHQPPLAGRVPVLVEQPSLTEQLKASIHTTKKGKKK
jgi:hypothetical protein